MSAVIEKPPLLQRLAPLVRGFDGPLAFAVFLLACMASYGYFLAVKAHGLLDPPERVTGSR